MTCSHFKSLESVESQIAFICRSRNVNPDELEFCLDRFSFDEEDLLLELLREKLALQEAMFKEQGGSLDNVIFLSSR